MTTNQSNQNQSNQNQSNQNQPPPSQLQKNQLYPIVIYDGECGFCKKWIDYYNYIQRTEIMFLPYQECGDSFESIPRQEFEKAVYFFENPTQNYKGAEAIFKLYEIAGYHRFLSKLFKLYQKYKGFKKISDWAYGLVATNRKRVSKIMGIFLGNSYIPSTYLLTRWIFLKGLGVIYLAAFIGVWVQFKGLMGPSGIIPISNLMTAVGDQITGIPFLKFPTLFWITTSEIFSQILLGTGIAAAFGLIVGVAPGLMCAVLWIIYLSFVKVGSYFYSFQWDILLCEVGFLAIFFAPWQWVSKLSNEKRPSKLIIVAYRVLLCRFMLTSGIVKLASNDQLWWSLKALNVHYQTQPLPHMLSWYAHQLPEIIQIISCIIMFGVELIIPCFFLLTRPLRCLGGVLTLLFMLVIMLTGNYGFFNMLVIVLCCLLFDDKWFHRIVPHSIKKFYMKRTSLTHSVYVWGVSLVAIVVITMSLSLEVSRFITHRRAGWIQPLQNVLNPFYIVNGYGLFSVMTKDRPEIIIEGSQDGREWRPYIFKYKPDQLNKRPRWVMPYQPRLDWQMWFAALGSYKSQPWMISFMNRLLEGSEPVISLLDQNSPFQEDPPLYIRAMLYNYRFTTRKERKETGNWYSRYLIKPYMPPLKRRE